MKKIFLFLLRLSGAFVVSFFFSYLVDFFHMAFFGGTAHVIVNFTWRTLFSYDMLRGFLLPVMWTIIWLIALGLCWIVRRHKLIAIPPILYFLLALVYDIKRLYIYPVDMIISETGDGFGYYLGATLTFIGMLICYIACIIALLLYDPQSE